jgi:rhomboid-related protein 1/2/3
MATTKSTSYEMVNSQEWSRNDHNTVPQVVTRDEKTERTMERRKQYELSSLDNDWYPILATKLTKSTSKSRSFDQPDVGQTGASYHSQSRITIEDEIDGRGTFAAKDLEKELRSMHRSELEDQLGITWTKVREIIRRADYDNDGIVEYKDFLETVKQYRLNTEQESVLQSLVKAFAYAEEFTCFPPRLFMVVITLIETAFFIYHSVHLSTQHNIEITWDGPVPYCSVMIFNPNRRWEVWRYLTYMFVHIGISHYIFNMIMQILVGVFLEMEQEGWVGSLRVMAVYFSGVLAGSLGTSLSDPDTYIAGASGGCYALIAAHLATLALNWQEDNAVKIKKVIHRPLTRIVRLIFIIFLTVHDVGLAIYIWLYSEGESRTGFMGHFCGALAGLLVGIFILDNRR